MRLFYFVILFFLSLISLNTHAQKDSSTKVNNGKEVLLDTLTPQTDPSTVALAKKDSTLRKKHDPHKATIRSAIIPGWGQAYNRQYWKIPLVYGVLAIPASTFIYNNTWYQRTKDAYDILVNGGDTSEIHQDLQGLSPESLQYYRNVFRKNRDYSALFFLLAWGLNIADATVFAHLKDFDVSNDLSMRIQPDFNGKTSSLTVSLSLKSNQKKLLPTNF